MRHDKIVSAIPGVPDLADPSYSDNYLREAALADNASSETLYDPKRDGKPCRSPGVHEHWSKARDKKYSRNLGECRHRPWRITK